VEAQDPLRQRNVAALHDGADRDREMLAAAVALMQAGAVALALQAGDAVRRAAVGTESAVRPAQALKVLPGCVVIVEDRIGQVHGGLAW